MMESQTLGHCKVEMKIKDLKPTDVEHQDLLPETMAPSGKETDTIGNSLLVGTQVPVFSDNTSGKSEENVQQMSAEMPVTKGINQAECQNTVRSDIVPSCKNSKSVAKSELFLPNEMKSGSCNSLYSTHMPCKGDESHSEIHSISSSSSNSCSGPECANSPTSMNAVSESISTSSEHHNLCDNMNSTNDSCSESCRELESENNESTSSHIQSESTAMRNFDSCEVSDEDEGEEPSRDLHTSKLGRICRICGQMTVIFHGPYKGVPKQDIIKHVKKVWNVDISDEDSDIYPVNVCQKCERKIKILYRFISKRKKCELFRSKPAEFVEHTDENCSICLLKDEEVKQKTSLSTAVKSNFHQEGSENAGGDLCEVDSAEPNTQMPRVRRNPVRKRKWLEPEKFLVSTGCQTDAEELSGSIMGIEEHDYSQDQTLSQFLVFPKKLSSTREPYQKQSLNLVKSKYITQVRLKPLISHIDKFCKLQKENKIDTMFFMLIKSLREAGDRARETLVEDIWFKKHKYGMSLTEEECLAKRILLKQTKDQYKKEYSYYKEKLEKPVLKPPFILDKLEKTYFPEHVEYFVTDGESGPVIYQHEQKCPFPSYFAIEGSTACKKSPLMSLFMVGARWFYFDAVAKTIEEMAYLLESDIKGENDETCTIRVEVVDCCEEKRCLTNLGDKTCSVSNRGVQSKMITYYFGVVSMQIVTEKKNICFFKTSSNFVHFRPLMKALLSEGNLVHRCMESIEGERAAIAEKVFHITLPGGTRLRFLTSFTNPSPEARKDYRNISGLALSSTAGFNRVPAMKNWYKHICLELRKSWLATSPRLVQVGRLPNSQVKCSRCGELGHNVRKCSKPCDEADKGNVVRRRTRKKQRTSPSPSDPNTSGQDVKIKAEDPKIPDFGSGQSQGQHLLRQSLHHSQEDTLRQMETAAHSVNHNTTVPQGEEHILWSCPTLESNPTQIGTHASQDTQVLIADPTSSSGVEYHAVPQRLQISQGHSGPLCVWTCTVVPQQASSQQLTTLQQEPIQQVMTRLSQEISSVTQQPQSTQQEGSQHPQQMTVINQQSSAQQQTTHQHNPLINSASPHQTLSQEGTLTMTQHTQSSLSQPIQQLAIVTQQSANQSSAIQQGPELLINQHPQVSQSQALQLPSSQTVALVQQQQPSANDTSVQQHQMIHPQNSDLQPIIRLL